jgi:hypothetical protein
VTEASARDRIPEPLRSFLAGGSSTFRCEDVDWDVQVEDPAPAFLQDRLPPNALIIANNGCGDYLFLKSGEESSAETIRAMTPVFVYRHEGPEIEEFADDLLTLTNPPPPTASSHPTVFYADGSTRVMIGDHVSARDLLFRKEGRVVYLPGVSKKNREFEHGGLAWVGIRFASGSVAGAIVDPEAFRLKKGVRFLSRGTSEVAEIRPLEDLDQEPNS